MVIYIGADHKGFELKERLRDFLTDKGYEVVDLGNETHDPQDDYPDFAKAVADKVQFDYENAKGILICGSGVGVDIVANKFRRVRSALVHSPDQAYDSRNDDDTNVLCLPADYVEPEEAEKIALTWLTTPFSEDPRHLRRISKINEVDT